MIKSIILKYIISIPYSKILRHQQTATTIKPVACPAREQTSIPCHR